MYTLKDLRNVDIREEALNYNESTKIIDRIGGIDFLVTMPNYTTIKSVAKFFGVRDNVITRHIKANYEDFKADKVKKLTRAEVIEKLTKDEVDFAAEHYRVVCPVNDSELSFANSCTYVLTRKSILRLAILLRNTKDNANIIREYLVSILNINKQMEVSTIADFKVETAYNNALLTLKEKYKPTPKKVSNILKKYTAQIEERDAIIAALQEQLKPVVMPSEPLANSDVKRSCFVSMCRRLGSSLSVHFVQNGFSAVYNELDRKYGIDLKARKAADSNPRGYINYIQDEEWDIVLNVTEVICNANKVDVTDIIHRYRTTAA